MRHPPNPEKQDFIRLWLARNARPGGRSRAKARKYYGGIYHRLSAEERTREVEEGLERERVKATVARERSGKGRRRAGDDGVEQGRALGNGAGANAVGIHENGVRDVEEKGEEIEEQTALQAAQTVQDKVEAARDGEANILKHQDTALDGTTRRTDEATIPGDSPGIAVKTEVTITQEVVNDPKALLATDGPDENDFAEIDEQATSTPFPPAGREKAVVSEEAILLAAIKQTSESDQESRADQEKQNGALLDSAAGLVPEEDFAISEQEEGDQAENVGLQTPPATSPASAKRQSTSVSPEEKIVRFDETTEQTISPPELPASTAEEEEGYVGFPDDAEEAQEGSNVETSTPASIGKETSPIADEEQDSKINPETSDQNPAIPERDQEGAAIAEDRPAEDKHEEDQPVEDEPVEDKPAEANSAKAKPADPQTPNENDPVQPPDPVEKRDIRAIARAYAQEFGQKKTKQAAAAHQRRAAAEEQAAAQAAGTQPDLKSKATEEGPEAEDKDKGGKEEEGDGFSPEADDSEPVILEDEDSDDEGKGGGEKAANEQQEGEREEDKAEDEPEEGDYEREDFSDDDGEDQDDEGIANTGDHSEYPGNDNNDGDDDGDFDEMEDYFDNLSPDDLSFLPGPSAPMANTLLNPHMSASFDQYDNYGLPPLPKAGEKRKLPSPSAPTLNTFAPYASETFDPYDTYEPPPLPKAGEKRKLPQGLEGLDPGVAAAFVDYQSENSKEDGKEREFRTPDGPPQKRPRLRRPGPQRQEDSDPGTAHATDPPRPAASPVDEDGPATSQTSASAAGASGAGTQHQPPAPSFSFSSLMKEIGGGQP